MKNCFYASHDGLRLHYLDVAATGSAIPAVCLPGLTRNARDFEPLAFSLARRSKTPRRVIALDYRGRGLSQHDPDWRHYDMATERQDILQALDILGIRRAHMIGTSRGGLHIMALAATDRSLIQSAVLNDIGPVLEPDGLRRIKAYIGREASPKSYAAAIELLKTGGGRGFDGLDDAGWRFFAETTFGTDEAQLRRRYDPQVARALDALDLTQPLPDSWALYDQLRGTPLLAIRGAHSDLLSSRTLAEMASRWPGVETVTIAGQAHAPLLIDAPTIARIDHFLAYADLAQSVDLANM